MTGISGEPLYSLTVEQFLQLLDEHLSSAAARNSKSDDSQASHRHVYGLRGIETLFGVSHKTAQMYKDTFLAPAVKQNGRKIVVDADLALELFNQHKGK